MAVTWIRTELNNMLRIYDIIRDCIEGEPAIKGWLKSPVSYNGNPAAFNGGGSLFDNAMLAHAKRYLPMPNAHDQSTANQESYKAYLTRAVWYDVTSRTLDGLVGQIFLIPPVIEIPALLKPMLTDLNGEGIDFAQAAKMATRYNTSFGRLGIYVDFPQTTGQVSQADVNSGKVKPLIQIIAPWNIINWQTSKINGKKVLTCVVIKEIIDSYDDDEFEVVTAEQYRCLELVTDNPEATNPAYYYTVTIYEAGETDSKDYAEGDTLIPKDSTGKPFTYIPFTFVGAENNDCAVDKPPLQSMVNLNIGHYRNSADYEQASFQMGQPTPWVSGIDQDWYENVMKKTIALGATGGVPLPLGAQIGLLQANPNQLPLAAMQEKEDQMLALGAKLVTQKRSQRTATQTKQDASSETSSLTNIADNVSLGFIFAFKAAARFVGAPIDTIKVSLNTEFELNEMTADDLSKYGAQWQLGGLTWDEYRGLLRKAGVANEDDATAKASILKDRKDGLIPPLALSAGLTEPPAPGTTKPNPNNDPAGHATTAQKAAAGN